MGNLCIEWKNALCKKGEKLSESFGKKLKIVKPILNFPEHGVVLKR